MTVRDVPREYARYTRSDLMRELARRAHGDAYCGQTSSATFAELDACCDQLALSKASHVLDLGSGNGCFAFGLWAARGVDVTGIELSGELVAAAQAEAARLNAQGVRFRRADFTLDVLSERPADLLLCVGSLYWGADLNATLRHWCRFATHNAGLILMLNVACGTLNAAQTARIGHTRFVEERQLLSQLTDAGFNVQRSDTTARYEHWLERWCNALTELRTRLVAEMGEADHKLLDTRFRTYLELARTRTVRRAIVLGRRRSA